MTAAEHVKVETGDHIATVLLDRPPVNALTYAVFASLRDTFRTVAEDWNVRAVIFASASQRVFCAGADLGGLGNQGEPPPTDRGKLARDTMQAIIDCPVPVIAAVNGAALGGGLALVACCDIIIASEKASFACPEIEVGLLGASSHLRRMVGPYRMRELYYTARRVSASEMYEMGGVARVVAADDLAGEARSIAADIARKSPPAIRLAKEAIRRVEDLPLMDAYRVEQDYTARLDRYDDSKEAMAAVREKRAPKFKGR